MVSTPHFSDLFSPKSAQKKRTVQLGTDLGALGQKLLQKLLELVSRDSSWPGHGREMPRFMELYPLVN